MSNRKKYSTEDIKGILMLLLAIAIIVLVGYYYTTLTKQNAYNPETLCPYHKPYHQTVILLDKSDIWQETYVQKIENLIQKYAKQTEELQRFTIKVIESNEKNQTTVQTYFDACNPGKKANPLYQNPRRILEKYQKMFETPLQTLLQTLSSARIAKSSPLLQTIKETLHQSEAHSVTLVLLSDLWEYSSKFNFYQAIPSIKKVQKEYHFPKDKLKHLTLAQIDRSKRKRRNPKLIDFYKALTQVLNASFTHFVFIPAQIQAKKE